MPHSPEDKKRVITRLRRIRGQAEALEGAVASGAECTSLLQQLAALRGAATGLMTDVLEMHMREHFVPTTQPCPGAPSADPNEPPPDAIAEVMRIVRSYSR